jgi:enolase-phosphatase E1
MSFDLGAAQIRSILLDIEGTTTPITFVYDVLFPFARKGIRDFLESRIDSDEIQRDLELLQKEHAADLAQGLTPPALTLQSRAATIESFTAYVHWLMDRDRKSSGLKSLQGKVWEQGYCGGSLRAQVFADVPEAFGRWRKMDIGISIFSSGSVLAQKLLFAHSRAGDLTRFLDHYFDTTTGAKAAAASYERIAQQLELLPAEVLFISDVMSELDAARKTGMQTLLCLRPGNPPPPGTQTHSTIESFDEIA